MTELKPARLFALSTAREFGTTLAENLDIPLAPLEERDFEDGEFKVRSLENVRDCHCFVVESLFSEPDRSINDKLLRLLCCIGSLKDAAAAKVTALVPYTAFARKDRKTKHRDPLTLAYLARLFEAVGTDQYVTMDIHNLQAYQNAFRIQTDHLKAENLFIDRLLEQTDDPAALTIMSPDVGGIKRATSFRDTLEKRLDRDVPLAFMEKKRSRGEVTGDAVIGDFADREVILVDDLVSSGTTLAKAAEACKERNAVRVSALVTHGIFSAAANDRLATGMLDRLWVTNTIQPFRLAEDLRQDKVTVIDAAPVFARAIRHIIEGTDLEGMWEEN